MASGLLRGVGEALEVASAAEYASALRSAVIESREAIESWLTLLWLVGRPVFRLTRGAARIAWPFVHAAAVVVAERVGSQPRTVLIVEAAALVLIVLVWRLSVLIRRRQYVPRLRAAVSRKRAELRRGVRRQSRALAAAAPHCAYAAACALLLRLAHRLAALDALCVLLETLSPLVHLALPALRSLLSLRRGTPASEQYERLRFWVIWATCRLVYTLAAQVPMLLRLAQPRWLVQLVLPFCFFAWLQLPHTGVRALYALVAPALRLRASRVRAALPALPAPARASISLVAGMLLPAAWREHIGQLISDGGALIGGLLLMMTPSPITRVGLAFFALAHPALGAIELVKSSSADAKPDDSADATGGTGECHADDERRAASLRYWVGYCVLQAALLAFAPMVRWLPFMAHAQLLAVLWLQLPIFRTATAIMLAVARRKPLSPRRRADDDPDGRRSTSPAARASGRAPRSNALYSRRLHVDTSATPASRPQKSPVASPAKPKS